jgi:SsrA-binding protein
LRRTLFPAPWRCKIFPPMAKKKKQPTKTNDSGPERRVVTRNRKARHTYDVLEELECGVVLTGSEVKSIRDGKVSIDESYARVIDGELWWLGARIAEYPQANVMNHDPERRRKLLVHKRELKKFAESASQQGLTLVPLTVHFVGGKIKVGLAMARGRRLYDKRQKLRARSDREEMRQASR